MKAGHVATIRVNPRDCQSVLDILDTAGIPRQALSFAQCVSLALGCLLETSRASGVIPEPDEFEYLNRLSQYVGRGRRSTKVRMAEAIHSIGPKLRAPVLDGQGAQDGSGVAHSADLGAMPQAAPTLQVDVDSPEYKDAQKTLTQLLIKKEQFEDGVEGVLWTPYNEAEFKRCYSIIYPDG